MWGCQVCLSRFSVCASSSSSSYVSRLVLLYVAGATPQNILLTLSHALSWANALRYPRREQEEAVRSGKQNAAVEMRWAELLDENMPQELHRSIEEQKAACAEIVASKVLCIGATHTCWVLQLVEKTSPF